MASDAFRRLLLMFSVRRRDTFDLASFRTDFERFAKLFPPLPEVEIETVLVGGVRVERSIPAAAGGRRQVLFFHGGGYVSGSLGTHREMVSRWASLTGTEFLAADYRLAPEHPFPAALEDALAIYRGLLQGGAEPRKLAVAGDSAGGGLTVALLKALRDAGDPLPAAAVLFSPWVDLTLVGESIIRREKEDKALQRSILERTSELYLAGENPAHPLVSPLFGSLAGLPPMLIQVGTAELLLDDSRRLAEKILKQDGEVELRVWEAMIHGWQLYSSFLPEGQAALEEAAEFLGRHLGMASSQGVESGP